MAVGDLIRLTVNQSLQSSIVQNVLYYKIDAEDSGGDDLASLALFFNGAIITPHWQALVPDEVAFDCLNLQKVFPTPEGAAQEFDTSVVGGKTGESSPAMNAMLIQKFNPAVGGVGKKGRVYIAGIRELDTRDGRVEAGQFVTLGALAIALQTKIEISPTGGEYSPVWAVRSPTTPFAITGSVDNLTFKALPRLATQRRRRTPIRATS